MNIAVYGGSFDPPHIAHIQTIQVALQKLDIDKLIVIVAYQNPLKNPCLFHESKRYEWMKRLNANLSKVEVSDMEIIQKKPIPSIQSVLALKDQLHPKKIFFIIGEDNLFNLHKWERYEELRNLVEFVLIERYGYNTDNKDLYKISLPEVKYKISSTQIREGLSLGHLPNDLPETIKSEVIKSYKELN
ncbi:nicotinate (nicotinamide) nucleotide adenylyltransferase [Helicobacter sp. 13S00482-2]|uniref:nicotinate (nicotinamide) nucleotide adenylyltransferase n=1 Tax=Helicobacter sp. 13S00482-2 TaxID=1476200 RepID=UPI000BA65B3F|nr:nicotinate (nicotinamide) nucleotide adenylyltransferase [Helicobacter sp. 13S00482-2]PAF53869.1 nicotinate (nicotinamide) nucleotide adenylyltransferase [Helicobacter sp. 13S00482-2]